VADELVVATVTAADSQPGTRARAFLLTLDLGTYGSEQAVMAAGAYEADALVGTQVLCRRADDGAIVVAARSHAKGDVPLRPDVEVEPGTLAG
jgi:hypothetical protein